MWTCNGTRLAIPSGINSSHRELDSVIGECCLDVIIFFVGSALASIVIYTTVGSELKCVNANMYLVDVDQKLIRDRAPALVSGWAVG